MKTINKTIALLFAAAAFTACIEPVLPATQPQAIIARPNTTHNRSTINTTGEDEVANPDDHKKPTLGERIPLNDYQPVKPAIQPQPRPVTEPATKHPEPRLDVLPKQTDSLPY